MRGRETDAIPSVTPIPGAVWPRVSFGMIVLNGEPFVTYNLRAVYELAHEIIVVEGACAAAKAIAGPDGHSRDTTLQALRQFQRDEDPEQKVRVVTAEDAGYEDGVWPEKLEMSQAYASRATGDYIWQLDYDEFCHPEDMKAVLRLLARSPEVKWVSLRFVPFWGGFDYRTDGLYLRQGMQDMTRVFAWGKNFSYVNHRPPTVVDDRRRDVRRARGIHAKELAAMGIYIYHYSFVLPSQVDQKYEYHSARVTVHEESPRIRARRERWLCNYFNLADPFLIDDTSVVSGPSWLKRFTGRHPESIENLRRDIEEGQVRVEARKTADIEQLLAKPWYRCVTRVMEAFDWPLIWTWRVASAFAARFQRMRGQKR